MLRFSSIGFNIVAQCRNESDKTVLIVQLCFLSLLHFCWHLSACLWQKAEVWICYLKSGSNSFSNARLRWSSHPMANCGKIVPSL